MRNKYAVPNQEPFNGRVRIYDNNEKHYVYSFMLRGDAEELADKLNRLAALEEVCEEIMATISTKEALGVDGQYEYQIAQKLKAALEEA